MLLQPSVEIAVGQEVELEFRIGETPAALHVLARIARKEEMSASPWHSSVSHRKNKMPSSYTSWDV